MLRVMTIVGTRPELIRLSLTIAKLDEFCDHKLVHTGQNYDYELNEIFFRDLGIRRPDAFLEAAGTTAAETIGKLKARPWPPHFGDAPHRIAELERQLREAEK